ncbi:MAG: hypothetical protein ACYDEB_06410, partial [Dehalococcoidia bacterium]
LVAATLAVTAIVLIRAPRGATATGVGPTLAVGTPSLVAGKLQVPIVAQGSGFSPYTGANLDLRWDATLFRFAGISTAGGVYQNNQCLPAPIALARGFAGVVVNCTAVSPTTATGVLVTVALTPLGVGCSDLHLITAGPPDFGGTRPGPTQLIYGSFTYDAGGSTQVNAYGPDRTSDVTGVPCTLPTPTSTPTQTSTPTPTTTPTETSTPTMTSTPSPLPTVSHRGPPLAVGTPSLVAGKLQVPIVAQGTAVDPYNAYTLHLRWDPTLFTLSGARTTGTVFGQTAFCLPPQRDGDGAGVAIACTSVGGSTTNSGLLATILLAPVSSGCSILHLFTFGPPDHGDANTGTFTVNAANSTVQTNTYVDGTTNSAGAPCTPPPPTSTPTFTPTWTFTPTPTSTPTLTSTPTPTHHGPTIAVGAPSIVGGSLRVPIDATSAPFDPFDAFQIHLRWDPVVFSFGGASAAGGVLDTPAFCTNPRVDPDGAGVLFWCERLAGRNAASPGLMATVTLIPGSSGCSALHLVTMGQPDDGGLGRGTYTSIVGATQTNAYSDRTSDVGGAACAPPPSPTPTRTPTATSTPGPPTATSTPTLIPTPTGTIVAGQPQIFIMNSGICTAVAPRIPLGCVFMGGLSYLPSTGDMNLREAANLLGNNNGVIEPADFASVDAYTAGQVHQLDGGAYMSLSNFPVIAFVQGSGPVLFSTTAGTFSESGSATWLCTGTGWINPDSDCGGPNVSSPDPALGPDHVVVAYLSCAAITCPQRGPQHITVIQNGISYTRDFTVVGEPVRVTLDPLSHSLEPGVLPADPITGAPRCSANLLAPGDLGRSKAILLAHAFDADGREVTGAWLSWSTSDPTRALVSGPFTPTLAVQGSPGAPILTCVPLNALPGSVKVNAQLTRTAFGLSVDPFADPGNPDPNNLASASTTLNIGAPATVTPTSTATPSPSPTASATPSPPATSTAVATATNTPLVISTATSTAVATATNTPLVVSTATPTAVATATNTPLVVSTATPTSSPASGVTPTPALAQTAATTAPARGVAAAAPSPTFQSSVLGTSARSGTTLPNTGAPAAGARAALAGFLAALAVAAGIAAAGTGWRIQRRRP